MSSSNAGAGLENETMLSRAEESQMRRAELDAKKRERQCGWRIVRTVTTQCGHEMAEGLFSEYAYCPHCGKEIVRTN